VSLRETSGELDAMIAAIRSEFPTFRVVPKRDDRLSHVIDRALRIVTLGAQHEYLSHYHTVLGNTLYVPLGWDDIPDAQRIITLRHELVHLRQNRRWGFPLFAFLYLVPFFPLGLAYGRARIEWEAYEETVRATAELLGPDAAESPQLRSRIVEQFTSGAYGWMWPFPRSVHRWYDDALEKIRAGTTPQTQGNLRP
jgi:hypothetical protein